MIRTTIVAAALLLAACQAQPSARPTGPSDFDVRIAVAPAPGGGLQRAALPAEALAALRSPERADIRVYNASGAPLTTALVPLHAADAIERVRLDAFPILGRAGALGGEDTELRIERRGGDRIVTVLRDGAGSDADANGAVTLGALIDARAITRRARSIRLDATLPVQQPVDILIEASGDLATWTRVGGRTLYRRTEDESGALGPEAIRLDDGDLGDRYLRVTWSSPKHLLTPVEIRAAEIEVEAPTSVPRVSIATTPPRREKAHDVRFALPHPANLDAIAIEPAAGEPLLPVRILGRNGTDQTWTQLGAGNLRGPSPTTIELSGGAFSDYRIEADSRTPGFAAPPGLQLLYEPATLVVLFDGDAPYTLAAGAAGAESRYLEPDKLIPGYRPGAEARLPEARITSSPAARVTLASGDDGLLSPRKMLLWGLLLLGVAMLGVMVKRLWRPKAG